MAEELSDAELLARHNAGDPDAFGTLVHRHRDRLWAVALRTLGDREEAADALQDALVSAFRSAHTFQGRSAVTTWLHRIVVNACLDRARRAATRQAGSLDEDPQRLDAALGSAEPTEAVVVRAEFQREITAFLATLPVEQRAALILVDMQGYPVAEAAEMLGVPVGTVKSRCARGRARLLPLVRHLHVSRETQPRETPPRETGGVSRETGGTGTAGRASAVNVSRETETGGNPPKIGSVPGENPNQVLEGDVTPR